MVSMMDVEIEGDWGKWEKDSRKAPKGEQKTVKKIGGIKRRTPGKIQNKEGD